MEPGNTVRLIQPVIEGTILDTRYDHGAKGLSHLVAWIDEGGSTQQRWFSEVQLEVQPEVV